MHPPLAPCDRAQHAPLGTAMLAAKPETACNHCRENFGQESGSNMQTGGAAAEKGAKGERARQAHCKVQGEDGDAVRQQHVQRLLSVAPAAAVAVAVDDHRLTGGSWHVQAVVAALQLQTLFVHLRTDEDPCSPCSQSHPLCCLLGGGGGDLVPGPGLRGCRCVLQY